MKKISIIVIEDNRILREGIVSMLMKQNDFKIMASFGDAVKAMQRLLETPSDIVLLDLGLRNQNSLNFVKNLKKKSPEVNVIVMDLVATQDDVLLFVKAGVSGFLLKDATVNDFIATIRLVSEGKKVIPTFLTESLFTQIINNAIQETDNSKIEKSVRMTKRERQVIDLVAEGLSNKEIAQNLFLSPYTVKSHIHNILEKLALHTRVQIARYAHTSNSYNSELNPSFSAEE